MRSSTVLFFLLIFFIPDLLFGQCDGLGSGDNDSGPYNITGTCVISGDVLLKSGSLTISSSGSLEINGAFTNEGGGSFNVDGGSFDVSGLFENKGNGNVNITNGASFVSGTPGDTDLRFDNQNDGVVTVSGNSTMMVNGDYFNNNSPDFNSGGIVEVTGDFEQNGNGDLIVTGGLIVGGTLTNKDGDVTIQDGAVLQANAVSFVGSGDLTIQMGGTLATSSISDISKVTNSDGGANPCPDGCCGALCDGAGTSLSTAGLVVIGQAVLPIELLRFDASQSGNSVEVNWTSATEINNHFYTVQRSYDGLEFEEIADIEGAGDSNSSLDYQYVDFPTAFGLLYYRLKQTDFDGAFEVFAPKVVKFLRPDIQRIQVSPTIVGRGEYVHTPNVWGEIKNVDAWIIGLNGISASIDESFVEKGNLVFRLPELTTGLYIFTGAVNGLQVKSKLIVN